jgi:hypothetical protein
MATILRLDQEMSLHQGEDATAGAFLSLRMWQRRYDEAIPRLAEFESMTPLPVTSTYLAFLLRAGRVDQAREHVREHPVDLSMDDWFSMLNWSCAAEVALGLEDHDLAAAAYERLAPYAGRCTSAGSGNATGPVDAFLAHAAAAVGDLDLAAQHADRALELAEEWQIPLVAQWLRVQRDRYGF